MSAIPTFRLARPTRSSTATDAGRSLSLLTPSSHCTRISPVARFSTSPPVWVRVDNNKNRGNSAVRATGLRKRQVLSVTRGDQNIVIPKPVERTSTIRGDPRHGLWQFFKNKQLLATPVEESRHGRPWTVNELRSRDWETLQQLWWVCVKERNRLATEKLERKRVKAHYGDAENESRDEAVQKTMKAVIDTLVERNQAYREAYKLAQNDPTIDLTRSANQYQEPAYEVEELDDKDLEDVDGAVPDEVREQQGAAPTAVFEEPQRPKDQSKQQTI